MYGLKEKHIKAINSGFSKYPQIEKALLYGSRAKGNYRNGSDIDLTLVGDDLDLSTLLKIETELDDLLLPYKMDLSILHKIENQDLVDHIERVGIVFYEKRVSEWKEDVLENIALLEKESWKVGDENLPYIALEHIVEGGLRLQGIGDSNTIASNKYRFNSDCFLFGKLRPYFRKLYRPSFEGICSTDIWVVKPKGENDKDFLFYFFANQEFVDFTYSGSSGTRMPRADWKFVGKSKWYFPEPTEQKQIAEVLTSLDDKIDLLHRQNKTLEAMADTLFREWFVARAEEDWEEKPLSEVTDIGIGRTPPRKEFHWFTKDDKDVKWVSIKDLGESGIFVFDTSEYLTQDAVEKFNIPIIPTETVILSFKMTLGRVAITTEKMLSNEAIAHFKFNSETPFCKEYLYFYLKTYPYQILGSTSSIVTSINSGMIKNLIIRIPNKELMKEFDKASSDYFGKIKSNQIQIQTLENLRDTLLPKLMSGEIKMNIN